MEYLAIPLFAYISYRTVRDVVRIANSDVLSLGVKMQLCAANIALLAVCVYLLASIIPTLEV